jgi:hypothetical protein
MIIKFSSFTQNEAHSKLSHLGMALYYAYLLFAAIGAAGFIFGLLSMVLKFINKGLAVNTPWLEVIALTLICRFMIKFFLRESATLVRFVSTPQQPSGPEPDHEVVQVPPVFNATIIPFKSKSQW